MKFVGLIMAFLVIVLLGFLTIGFTSSQTAPDPATTAGQQYQNYSNATEIGFQGLTGATLLLVVAIVLAALFLLVKVVII